ncbi:hypothetical protein AAGW29_004604 [Escherichia coli]
MIDFVIGFVIDLRSFLRIFSGIFRGFFTPSEGHQRGHEGWHSVVMKEYQEAAIFSSDYSSCSQFKNNYFSLRGFFIVHVR